MSDAEEFKSKLRDRIEKDLDFPILAIKAEVSKVMLNFPPFNSAHEGFAVLKEEVDELWDQVKIKQKNRDLDKMKSEAIQVAAMALRFIVDVCDERAGRK